MFSRRRWPALLFAAVAASSACWRWTPDWTPLQGPVPEDQELSQTRYLLWSAQVRRRIARGLMHGDLSLREAAACFRQVNALRPAGLPSGSSYHQGNSEEERLCRQVIQYVHVLLEEERQEDGLLRHLEAELAERVRQGNLRLSAPPSGIVEWFDLAKR
jgi:hypothetical protein